MFRCLTLLLVLTIVCESWSVPKPMESITNYNVLMVHGAYGADKGISEDLCKNASEASFAPRFLNSSEDDGANIGYYHKPGRLTSWLESLFLKIQRVMTRLILFRIIDVVKASPISILGVLFVILRIAL